MIKNGVNGFIFRNENADDLAQKMNIILTHRERLYNIGKRGKEMYEKHLSTETAKKNWLNFIETLN
jgi:glycosyltransferase involved in cell wall biosynthesis